MNIFISRFLFSFFSQWRKVIQELDLKSVKSGKINSAIFVELLETTPIFGNVVEMTTQKLKQSIVDLLKDPVALKEKLEKERVIDVKKALKLSQVMALIPTDMGLPLVVDVTMPMLVSVKGILLIFLWETTFFQIIWKRKFAIVLVEKKFNYFWFFFFLESQAKPRLDSAGPNLFWIWRLRCFIVSNYLELLESSIPSTRNMFPPPLTKLWLPLCPLQ